jgi:hypothetical protein
MMKSNRIDVEIENSDHELKELYHSPKVEIIEVKVEKGFAASPVDGGGSSTGDWGSGGGW